MYRTTYRLRIGVSIRRTGLPLAIASPYAYSNAGNRVGCCTALSLAERAPGARGGLDHFKEERGSWSNSEWHLDSVLIKPKC